MASQRKGWQYAGILAGIALVILIIAVLCFLLGAVFPPLAALGAVFIFAAIALGIGAISRLFLLAVESQPT